MHQGGQLVTDPQKEDGADHETVSGRQGGDEQLHSGTILARGEDSGRGCGHQGIHHQQPCDKAEQPQKSPAGAS